MRPLIERLLLTKVLYVMGLKLGALAPLDRLAFNLHLDAALDEVPDLLQRLLNYLGDGGQVEDGSGGPPYLTGAITKKEEVVDELLVLRHAKYLLRESGFPLEVAFLLFCVAAALWHLLC